MPNWHFKLSLHIQLALDAEFLDALAQRGARDAQQLRRLNLVVARLLERLHHQFTLHGGNDF